MKAAVPKQKSSCLVFLMPRDFVDAVAAPPAVVVVAFPLPVVVAACVVGAAFPCEIYIEVISTKVQPFKLSPIFL